MFLITLNRFIEHLRMFVFRAILPGLVVQQRTDLLRNLIPITGTYFRVESRVAIKMPESCYEVAYYFWN